MLRRLPWTALFYLLQVTVCKFSLTTCLEQISYHHVIKSVRVDTINGDADHAGDHINRRSHTGMIVILNKAPILWYSKRQTTVDNIAENVAHILDRYDDNGHEILKIQEIQEYYFNRPERKHKSQPDGIFS